MSFIINWDLIRYGAESKQLKDYLNERFAEVDTPDFLGSIYVSELDFGDIPPEIAIENICDPWPVFYDTAEVKNAEGRNGVYDSTQLDSLIDPEELAQSREMHTQVEVSISYHGNMRIRIQTELIVNQPTPRFLILPVSLTLTGFSIETTALTAFVGAAIFFCLKQPPPGQMILPNLLFESEVGDADRSVLKNVGKIEKFIAEQIRKFFDDYLVYPNYHSILIEADDDNTSDLISNLS